MNLNKDILNSSEAAALLSIKKSSLYRLMRENKISYWMPEPNKAYFERADVLAYIRRNRHEAVYDNEPKENPLRKVNEERWSKKDGQGKNENVND